MQFPDPACSDSPSVAPTPAIIGTLPQFLLVLAGVSCFVVAFVHVPRVQERQGLERQDFHLRAQIEDLRAETDQINSKRRAFLEESHFRQSVLRRLTGEHPEGAMSVTDWLSRGKGAGIQAPD